MKTLKKTLCLVLAMVMVFGLCTISASAKLDSYSDKDAIKYEEAVDVLTGIGILQGSGGAFRPQATITRAEAAKIIAYLVIGDSKQADALKASSDPFTDVPADYWAAGYIAYCASVGIIKGMGDGSYHPLDNVKGLQFATMLLRALGYGKDGEFEGSDWSINASKWALSLKLFEGNLAGASATEDATREECALYAFNTITGPKKVTYSALLGGYTTTDNTLGDAANANAGVKFADDFKLKSKGADEDAFRRPTGSYWYIDSGKREAITATYGEDKNLKETYTAKVTGGDIYSLIDGAGKVEKGNLEVYRNGDNALKVEEAQAEDEEDTSPAATLIKTFKKNDDTEIEGTGAGVETYVYSWYTDEEENGKTVSKLNIKICIVDTYLAQVTEVIDATAKEDRKVEVNDLYSETNEDPLDDVDLTYTTEDFEEDDYVLITVAGKKIRSMVKAEPIKDEVTRVTKTGSKISIVVNGTTYTAAKNAINPGKGQSADEFTQSLVDGNDHEIFVDNHGYVIGANDVKTDSKYVFVSHFGNKTDVSGDFDGKGVAAKVYYADGTSAIVAVKKVGSTTIDDKTEASDLSTGIYKLKMDGSKAVLEGTSIDATGTPKKSRPSTVIVDGGAAAGSKTVFFYVNGAEYLPDVADDEWKDITVTAYTGIGTIPANKDGEDAENVKAIVDDEGENIVAVLVEDKNEGESDDTVYMYTGDYEADRTGWTVHYKTYVDGKTTDLDVKYSDAGDKDTGTGDTFAPMKGKFVTVKGKTPTAVGGNDQEYSKSKYYDGIDAMAETTTKFSTSEIVVADGVDAAFAQGKDLTVVNISGKGKELTTLKKLVAAKDAETPAYTSIKIAVQVKDGEVVALYITDLVEVPEVAPGDEEGPGEEGPGG